MRAALFALSLTSALLYAPGAVEAGVVVLKSGEVVLGEIAKDDVTEGAIVLHPRGRGAPMTIPRRTIRWFSRRDDAIPDRYWERYSDQTIDEAYRAQRERWRLRKKREPGGVPLAERDLESLARPVAVVFEAPDGLQITGDLYGGGDKTRPFVLLCHMAGSSRGEYASIAPRLVKLGYACLAIDQRSGRAMSGVSNLTALRAAKAGKPQGYPDARQDIQAAIAYLRGAGYTGKLTLWGSSYSASLALMIGASSKEVSAVIAFSPGDYLRPKGTVASEAKALTKPLLVLAPEKERAQATALVELVQSEQKTLLIDEALLHGSRTLFLPKPAQTKLAWDAVLTFLEKHGR